MRDVPRKDTQPERHAQLLLCMFKPFFKYSDLRLPDDVSWTLALQRTDYLNQWDALTGPMRDNIAGMLRQRLAADREIALRKEEAKAARASDGDGSGQLDTDREVFNDACDDDDTCGTNVMPPAFNAHNVLGYVNGAKYSCIDAEFSKNDRPPPTDSALLSGRSPQRLTDAANGVNIGLDAATARASLKAQMAVLKKRDAGASAPAPVDEPVIGPTAHYDSAALEPYIVLLRSKLDAGLSSDSMNTMANRRRTTNQCVAESDVGRTYPQQLKLSGASPTSLA